MRFSLLIYPLLLSITLSTVSCSDETSPETPAPTTNTSQTTSSSADVGSDDTGSDDTSEDTEADADAENCPAPSPSDQDSFLVQQGLLHGTRTGDTLAFLGIPFTAPPTGELRWKAPQDPACFDPVEGFHADSFGSVCPQIQADGSGPVVGDEDCLTLNIWVPPNAQNNSETPVMAFIHGGGNVIGSSAPIPSSDLFIYDGQLLAEETGHIVVTFNYRIGALGWLTHPALDAEDTDNVSGNYGTLDQVAALQWIQDNISALGGDPDTVMVFGESAGAVNTCMMFVTPKSAGLFHSALMQSGGCPNTTRDAAQTLGQEFVASTSCDTADDPVTCLRNLPPEDLFDALPPTINLSGLDRGFGPHTDGVVIPDAPAAMIARGEHNPVPLIIGANSDETSRSTPAIPTEAAYEDLVRSVLGPILGNQALAVYPAEDYDSPRDAYIQLSTDAKFVCPARSIARVAKESGRAEVYRYVFSHALDRGNASRFGAWHGLELLFLFTDLQIANYVPTDDELSLSQALHTYWANFAATGTPGDTPTTWGPYNASTDPYLNLDGGNISMRTRFREEKCDFWDNLTAGK